MNGVAQISEILSARTFWEEDKCSGWSLRMVGGMSVGIDQQGSTWTWIITGPGGNQWPSQQAFPSVRAAKNDLHAELQRGRDDLGDQSVGPATVRLPCLGKNLDGCFPLKFSPPD
jgi:hypothetical protein